MPEMKISKWSGLRPSSLKNKNSREYGFLKEQKLSHSRDLKLGYCGILNALFPVLAFFKSVTAHNIKIS